MTAAEGTRWIVRRATALGFDLCGVAPAEGLVDLERLPEWLACGYAGEMKYLHDPRRGDPRRVLEGAQSVIVCAMNYNTAVPYSTEATRGGRSFSSENTATAKSRALAPETSGPRGWISRYAWGDDYHEVLGTRLEEFVAEMRVQISEPFEALWYVDTGPVAERVAAKHAGLGWLAKNTCLINEQLGSWLFLGVILTTLKLEPSIGPAEAPPADLCGNCTMCIDACPTGALVEPYVLDARRCISYLTIELRGSIPEALRAPLGRMVFGCDICQDVCPWNRKAPITSNREFLPRYVESSCVGALLAAPEGETRNPKLATGEVNRNSSPSLTSSISLLSPSLEFLVSLNEGDFRRVFRGSAIKRTKWRGLVRNACVALGNALAHPAQSGVRPGTEASTRITSLLERLAASDDALIAEHARWALEQARAG